MKIGSAVNKLLKQEKARDDMRKATSHLLKDLDEERLALVIAKAKEDALLASIGDGVIAVDSEETVILINRAAEAMLGYRAKEILRKKIHDVLPIEDARGKKLPEEKRPIHVCLTEGKTTVTSLYYYERKNGTKIPVAITETPILLDKKIIGSVNVFHDITKEKELDQAKDEFIALASHQLNSPITAIMWSMEALLGGSMGKLNSGQKETMEKILQRSKNMAALIGGFLDATKLESSGFKIEKGDVDLLKICDSLLEESASQIADKKITIVKKYGGSVPHLDIGEKTARIIIQNLLTNAVKYTPPKERLN